VGPSPTRHSIPAAFLLVQNSSLPGPVAGAHCAAPHPFRLCEALEQPSMQGAELGAARPTQSAKVERSSWIPKMPWEERARSLSHAVAHSRNSNISAMTLLSCSRAVRVAEQRCITPGGVMTRAPCHLAVSRAALAGVGLGRAPPLLALAEFLLPFFPIIETGFPVRPGAAIHLLRSGRGG